MRMFQVRSCLSGMFERGDDVIFICYDNEAYEHGRPALRARAAGGAYDDDSGGGSRAGAGVRPGQEPPADRDGARDPPTPKARAR
jgi:hypothetical protein